MNDYIGIDVAKATLQIYIPKNELDIEIENSLRGLKKFYNKLKKLYKKEIEKIVFVYESTGSYSTLLEYFSQTKEIRCFKVGAAQSSFFSKSIKNRSKTDKIDARMLSSMHVLVKENDIKVPLRDEKAHQIRSFIKYYQSIGKEKIRLSNYLEGATYNLEDSYILKDVNQRISKLDKEQDKLIEKIMHIIENDKSYLDSYENIISIPGVGQKSAIILLYLFLRYPNASRQHITALCGLDPVQRESGTSLQKKARISKQGLSLVRDILFMPTLSVVRYNMEMKHMYDRLVDRGKPKPLAQIAIMRKIVLLAHSLYKNKQQYDPDRYLNFTQIKKVENMK
ncbi:MAG: IS110 family transposase [Sulfurimonas sp.]|nr:IS110 family transposase [Sulfurimonas sp.]